MQRDGAKRIFTIKREMFLLSFAVSIFISLLLSVIFLRLIYTSNMENAKNSLRQCNNQVVTYTEGMFHENASILEILSGDQDIINKGFGRTQRVVDLYNPILNGNANITYLYSGYADGDLLIGNYNTPQSYDPTDRPWYMAAVASDGVARLVYRDAATNVWLFSQCRRLVDYGGRITGVIAIDCSNENITKQLSTQYQYASQRSFIVDENGTILLHPDEREINASVVDWMDTAAWNLIVSERSNYIEYSKNNIESVAYFERIPETGFFVVTAIDASEVTKPVIHGIIYLFLIAVAISIILGIVLSRLLIHRFALPMVELGRRIRSLAAGQPEPAKQFQFSNTEIDGIAQSIEVIVNDIASREEQRKAAEYLGFHDSMTGLYNRRYFDDAFRRMKSEKRYPFCLICSDINGLKMVNDVFGHAIGDRLIVTVARWLESECSPDDILSRIGGDEFAMILPGMSWEAAHEFIQKMRRHFPHENICGAEVSASLGYAVQTDDTSSTEDVFKEADEMMYDRKMVESELMKTNTAHNIITAAEKEGLVRPLSQEELSLLNALAAQLCPDSQELLCESYRLRKLGLCTLVLSATHHSDLAVLHHTETGYRILSPLEAYRATAGAILHYSEHWDGSGWPGELAGKDIPLLSRIMSVTEAYFEENGRDLIIQNSSVLYDPELVRLILENTGTSNLNQTEY